MAFGGEVAPGPSSLETPLPEDALPRRIAEVLAGEGELPPRMSCFAGNEEERLATVLERLSGGAQIVYVSEAGMPVWSDPALGSCARWSRSLATKNARRKDLTM